jgi:competence protein ComEA
MPDIGPELARRIVADRQERGPFRDLDDLRRVRGIGPRTLEAMKPYLLPLADLEATAEAGNGGRPAEGTVN